MKLQIKIEAFEGPLDLLLHLIEKNKLDIFNIPISTITDQYLEYIDLVVEEDLDLASEFLVMAAHLLMIKSKLLLPQQKEEEIEQANDLKDQLQEKLIQLKTIKKIANLLKEKYSSASMILRGVQRYKEDILSYKKKPDLSIILKSTTLDKVKLAYIDAINRANERIDNVRSKFKTIKTRHIDINKRLSDIKILMKKNKQLNFRSLLPKDNCRLQEVVTFLILLEMVKTGYVNATQKDFDKDIDIKVLKDPNDFGINNKF